MRVHAAAGSVADTVVPAVFSIAAAATLLILAQPAVISHSMRGSLCQAFITNVTCVMLSFKSGSELHRLT